MHGVPLREGRQGVKSSDERGKSNELAEAAIVRVLAAEREACAAVEAALLDVHRIAEAARAEARALAERTERRIRKVVGAFERDLAARIAEIDAEAERLDSPQPLTPAELEALRRAVGTLARELSGVGP
jgi:hypothetical protein